MPVVTPREYSASLFGAIIAILGESRGRGPRYAQAVRALVEGRPSAAVRALSMPLGGTARDLVAHRTLALAQLDAGNLRGAARHLELSIGLARRGALCAPSLAHALRAHLDGALARLVLLPIYAELGQRDAARTLVTEGLIL